MILGAQWSVNLDNFSSSFIDLKTIIYHLLQADNGTKKVSTFPSKRLFFINVFVINGCISE